MITPKARWKPLVGCLAFTAALVLAAITHTISLCAAVCLSLALFGLCCMVDDTQAQIYRTANHIIEQKEDNT